MPRFFGQSGGIRFKQGVHRELCGVALNKMRKEKTIKQKTASDFETPSDIMILHSIIECLLIQICVRTGSLNVMVQP